MATNKSEITKQCRQCRCTLNWQQTREISIYSKNNLILARRLTCYLLPIDKHHLYKNYKLLKFFKHVEFSTYDEANYKLLVNLKINFFKSSFGTKIKAALLFIFCE